MISHRARATLYPIASFALTFAIAGCSLLPAAKPAPTPRLFTLEPDFERAIVSSAPLAVPGEPTVAIAIAEPRASAGFESPRMAYVTRAHEIQYFTRHRWVEPPARLLRPLLARALERSGRWRPTPIGRGTEATLRLETEIVALQQEFTTRPSRIRMRRRAELFEARSGRPLVATEIEAIEPTDSEDAYGGVVAANRAVARVLDTLVTWAESSASGSARDGD